MKKNVGKLDRVIRVLIVVAIAILYFTNIISGSLALILFTASMVLLVSSLVGWYGLYSMLGISSKSK